MRALGDKYEYLTGKSIESSWWDIQDLFAEIQQYFIFLLYLRNSVSQNPFSVITVTWVYVRWNVDTENHFDFLHVIRKRHITAVEYSMWYMVY